MSKSSELVRTFLALLGKAGFSESLPKQHLILSGAGGRHSVLQRKACLCRSQRREREPVMLGVSQMQDHRCRFAEEGAIDGGLLGTQRGAEVLGSSMQTECQEWPQDHK